jgi:hypothetical protein
MLKLNKDYKGHDLEQQFNLNFDDSVPELWSETQDKVNAVVRKQVEEHKEAGTEDPDFDATEALSVFFGAFNTQELQDAALLQFVIRDIQERTTHIAHSPDRDELRDMLLQSLSEGLENENGKDGFPPFL